MTDVLQFKGHFRFLSNFEPALVVLDGCIYPTVEHAYQAAKTSEMERRHPFIRGTATDAKRLGRSLPMTPDWESRKVGVMLFLLRQKFRPQSRHGRLLNQTGTAKLVEGNHWGDTFWGVCDGEGLNLLGELLMLIREENRNEYPKSS